MNTSEPYCSQTLPSQPLHTPLKSPTPPEISTALQLLMTNLYKNIVHYLVYICYHKFLYMGRVPKAQSNRQTAVGWSSSKAVTHVVYYVRTFRHGSQIGAHHPGAAGWSTWATGHRRRSWGPCRLKTLLLTKGRGQEIPASHFSYNYGIPLSRRIDANPERR